MDVSNFLTGTYSDKDNLPSPENVAGFLVDGTKDVLQPVVDLTMPLGMTTVASSVMAPEFGDTKKYSHLLRMNMPSDVIIASFVNVLSTLLGSQGFEELKRQADSHGIEIAVEEKVGPKENIAATMDIIVHRLKIKQNAGARGLENISPKSHGKIVKVEIGGVAIYRPFGEFRRANSYCHLYGAQGLGQRQAYFLPLATMNFVGVVLTTSDRTVILLLPPNYINHLLSAVKRLQHLGRSRVGDFVWLAYDTLEPFQMFPDQFYSALVLRSQAGEIPAFKDYFTSKATDVTLGSENIGSIVASQPLLLIREQRCPRNTTWRSATCCPSRAVLPSFTPDIDLLDSPGEVESCDNPFTNTPIRNGSVCLVSKSGKMVK
ncbi:metabotropic glutamate receptor 7 [Trichonephila clavipes]|nr:metabotropic glutamate receptor 7 [Trichonephila clavipes]